MTVKCPKCKEYAVDFDNHFKRPRCYDCGWMPKEMVHVPHTKLVFDVCNRCWDNYDLRKANGGFCPECYNRGKVLNSIGEEVAELVRDVEDW